MKKFLLTGILGLSVFLAEGQVWKQLYDSTNQFWANDWQKTINLLLQAREDAVRSIGADDPAYRSIIGDLGVAYWKNNQFEAARPYLTASISSTPNITAHSAELISTLAHFATSDLVTHNENNAKAILKWIVYNNLRTDEPLLYYSAAVNLVSLYSKHGSYDSAVHVTNYINEQTGGNWSDNADWNLIVSRALFKAGKSTEAIRLGEKNLKRNKGSRRHAAENFNLRGEIFTSMGDFKSAVKSFEKARRLNRHLKDKNLNGEIYKNQVTAYAAQKNMVRAEEMCDEYLQITEPSITSTQHYAEIKNIKANIAFNEGRYREAITLYEELLPILPRFVRETNPVFVSLLNNLAEACVKTDQVHRAYVYLRWAYEMVDIKESRQADLAVNIITNLAEVYASKGDAAQADEHLREASMLKSSR